MTLLAPWWLLALPLWPLLLFLLRARDERRPLVAPDFLLWKRAAATLPPASSRARLSWRRIAWIVPPILLTLGLAEPAWRRASEPASVLVLVDQSASMETKGKDGASRRERGGAEARRLLGSRPFVFESVPSAGAAGLVEAAAMTRAAGRPVMVVTDLPLDGLPADAGYVQVVDDARNAGIVSAGFDPATGLLVRVEADPGAGPRALTVRDAGGKPIETRSLADPTSFRLVIPAENVASAGSVVVRLEPPDALPLDDEVTLEAAKAPVRVAVGSTPPPAIERALRAVPGVEIVHGGVGAAITLLVAPLREDGFETLAAVPREGPLQGSRGFEGLGGPPAWRAIHPLAKEPPGTERLLEAGGAPVLVRSGSTFALLADPDENGWSGLPGFPLTVARIVETGSAGSAPVLAPRPPFVLAPEETCVARRSAAPARAPAVAEAPPAGGALAPWAFGAAALTMVLLALSGIRPRTKGTAA